MRALQNLLDHPFDPKRCHPLTLKHGSFSLSPWEALTVVTGRQWKLMLNGKAVLIGRTVQVNGYKSSPMQSLVRAYLICLADCHHRVPDWFALLSAPKQHRTGTVGTVGDTLCRGSLDQHLSSVKTLKTASSSPQHRHAISLEQRSSWFCVSFELRYTIFLKLPFSAALRGVSRRTDAVVSRAGNKGTNNWEGSKCAANLLSLLIMLNDFSLADIRAFGSR